MTQQQPRVCLSQPRTQRHDSTAGALCLQRETSQLADKKKKRSQTVKENCRERHCSERRVTYGLWAAMLTRTALAATGSGSRAHQAV
jgi:hypothetical protein